MVLAILMVDDDGGVLGISSEYLRRLGHRVTAAASAREARIAVAEATRPYDLLIVDWALPDLSGRDLLQNLRLESPSSRIVVATGHGETVVSDQLITSGVASILRKPYTLRGLKAAVDAAFSEGTSAG